MCSRRRNREEGRDIDPILSLPLTITPTPSTDATLMESADRECRKMRSTSSPPVPGLPDIISLAVGTATYNNVTR